jgi:hypothetical protein
MVQLELWERDSLSVSDLSTIVREVRNLYWHIRVSRRGVHDARRRRVYRKIAVQKKRLLEAGVTKREILDLLACCRSKRCVGKGCFDCPERTTEARHPI